MSKKTKRMNLNPLRSTADPSFVDSVQKQMRESGGMVKVDSLRASSVHLQTPSESDAVQDRYLNDLQRHLEASGVGMLRRAASLRQVPGRSSMNKAELVQALMQVGITYTQMQSVVR